MHFGLLIFALCFCQPLHLAQFEQSFILYSVYMSLLTNFSLLKIIFQFLNLFLLGHFMFEVAQLSEKYVTEYLLISCLNLGR